VKQIRAVGGATGNALLNQIKADVLRVPLHVREFQETGVLGAALLGGLAAGVYPSFEQAVTLAGSMGGSRAFAPEAGRSALYEELSAVYADAYPATRDLMHRLARCGNSQKLRPGQVT
jgi:xylulokinase